MSKKNFKVATDNGQTPKQDTKHIFATVNVKKDNTPTGKVKTLKDKEALKKEREEQYKNFRIGALKRRAKRMGLTEEQTKVKVEELIKQIDTPNQYLVLVMFNPDDKDMNTQALNNEGIVWKMQGPGYFYIEADQDTLGTIRSIMTPGSKIHPYVKKKPPIIPLHDFEKSDGKTRINANGKRVSIKKRTKAEKKAAAKAAKKARKAAMNIKKREGKEYMKFRKRCNMAALSKAQKAALKAERKAAGTTTQKKAKKVSMASKKASTGIKKAA